MKRNNLGTMENPQCVKINVVLFKDRILALTDLLKEFKDVFAWTYKDHKDIPSKIAQHHIEFDTSILLVHQA